ncbi:unnamed protein product [Calicophoron daubneyi]|uniref:Ubiquitin-like protease family profile domain-containing protein n=1 Tax=Calicophoron daubneyi TaxID=300641 RepID=A0AAV2SW59_CALDB
MKRPPSTLLSDKSSSSNSSFSGIYAFSNLSKVQKRPRRCQNSTRAPWTLSVYDRTFSIVHDQVQRIESRTNLIPNISMDMIVRPSSIISHPSTTKNDEDPCENAASLPRLGDLLKPWGSGGPVSSEIQTFRTSATHEQCSQFGSILSSTPSQDKLSRPLFLANTPSERQCYRRLLNQAAKYSRRPEPSGPQVDNITIVIDDQATQEAADRPKVHEVSPIKASKGSSTIDIQMNDGRPILEPSSVLVKRGPLRPSSRLVQGSTEPADEETHAWLRACEQSPYLSDTWLANLTSRYQRKAVQRSRERILAEAKVKHWEKQRNMNDQMRMCNLEQRLACLLLTPPVLEDPYLVPQPIPIELPYQPARISVPKISLPVLTESQVAQIDAALRSGPPDAVLVENFRLSVTRRELTTLTGSNWLSDMVINFYMQLLYHRSQEQQQKPPLPRIAVLSTFFYAKLTAPTGGGYSGVRRWTRQLNLMDQDLVLIPIHDRGMHWCLACIDFRSKTITYFDSMGSPNDRCLKELKSYLENECLDKKGHPLPDSDLWRLVNPEDTVPQQFNGSDCGVFMCTFGEFISRNVKFAFTQEDMPGIRKRMIFEILTQQLLTTGYKAKPD